VGFFPLVGLVLGFFLVGIAYVLNGYVPALPLAVILVTILAAATGALHLDGLADLFDGLAGGRGDPRRTLEIMRDSRIGAQGAVALVLVMFGKVAALVSVLEHRDYLSLAAFPVVARWVVTPQIALYPYARAEGLGRAFSGEAGWTQVVLATGTMAAIAGALGAPIAKQALLALVVTTLMGLWLRGRLGGLTGDIYGATIEIGETTALMVASLHVTILK
jgi:adenosylcobinamide-GDP ribazoletransferase